MPLDLQLHRIKKLLQLLNNPHYSSKYIHVAGTNGKGSVCSYISHILSASGIKNGRFNSPHLITPRDSIQINNVPVSSKLFEKCKTEIMDKDKQHNIGCTEFELLTCIAFQIFSLEKISIAIMEVGLGGRLDATNVILSDNTLCVAVTKIGMDHEKLLGNNLKDIAYQKVGIFKPKVAAVIDGSNDKVVLEVAENEASKIGCQLIATNRSDCWLKPKLLGDYQKDNLAVALKVVDVIHDKRISVENIKKGVDITVWPGRLQRYEITLNEGRMDVLLDGAHNTQAAIELGKYLNKIGNDKGFVFVIGITKGKNLSALFDLLISKNDTVIFTKFKDEIEGMPWIEPTEPQVLYDQVSAKKLTNQIFVNPQLEDALQGAYQEHIKSGKQVVICGSLYLVADVLRL